MSAATDHASAMQLHYHCSAGGMPTRITWRPAGRLRVAGDSANSLNKGLVELHGESGIVAALRRAAGRGCERKPKCTECAALTRSCTVREPEADLLVDNVSQLGVGRAKEL